MRVYLAARYSQKRSVKAKARQLEELGITVTSTWLEEPHAPTTQMSEVPISELRNFAQTDLRDIDRADALVFFSIDPTTPTVRGGRHVEFGYALGTKKPILIVGPHENIFHHLSHLWRVERWTEAVEFLKGLQELKTPANEKSLQQER